MILKDSLFLLVSNLLGKGFGAGRVPTNDDEGFFVSADFKSFRKGVWNPEGDPLMMVKDSLFLLISNL